jgi:GT2 family glycosyltransferase
MSDSVDASIIIPTLRAGHDLVRALESLASDKDSPSHEVLVVFNSPKPSDIDLTKIHPRARAIQTLRNLGFASACNLGAREAVGDWLVFLNDDMTIRPGWLSALLTAMNERGCRAAGGRILSEDGKRVDFDGGTVNLLGWGFQAGHGEPVDEDEFVSHQWLPFACGGNFAIDPDVFHAAGGFDDAFFAFYEDVDLGWRLRLMGLDIAFVHEAVTLHASGTTGNLMPPALKWFLQERNALQTIIKNYSDEALWRILPIAFGMVAVRAQVLSGLDAEDIFPDKMWKEWVIGTESQSAQHDLSGAWHGILDSVKESLKAGMKSARKGSVPAGYLPIESRGAAGLLALEWCLNNWDDLIERRGRVQALRKRKDGEILPFFDDPLRPVLGHPREIEAMKPLEGVLGWLLGR